MYRSPCALLVLPLLAAASAPVQQFGPSLDDQLKQARAEQAAAEAETVKLENAVAQARNDVDRLRAEEAAAAGAVEAAEARLTAADARLRLASAYVAAHRRQLAEEQRPVASLLSGLAIMSRRPPLLAIADQRSVDELVEVRILLDTTVPVIRARTAKLTSQLSEAQRLEDAAVAARAEFARGQQDLSAKRQQFTALEQKALQRAAASSRGALSASDVAIAAGENVEQLTGAQAGSQSSMAMASGLARLDSAPPRPVPAEGVIARPPFAYELPVPGKVTEGLDAVNSSGVRSRGLTIATYRGAPVTAPAAGIVKFAGPYRDYDGVLIIDHGRGWMSLLVNISSELKPGDRVELGQSIGRALGPLQVELSQYGRRMSPALIAGSSLTLSKNSKGG